jgi:opacity protein-like surface antigen
MTKKGLIVLVLAAIVAVGGVFAQGLVLSAGAGGFIGGDFGGGIEGSVGGQLMKTETPYFGGGGFAFFDATYAELSLGISGNGGTMKVTGSPDQDSSLVNLNIGLLGKYPFAINDKLSVFPLLGIDYQVTLSAKIDGKDYEDLNNGKASDFSALWFKFGGGVDYSLTESLYLRLDLLYGIRLANKLENDMKDNTSIPGADVKTLLGHGLTVKVGVGYKF